MKKNMTAKQEKPISLIDALTSIPKAPKLPKLIKKVIQKITFTPTKPHHHIHHYASQKKWRKHTNPKPKVLYHRNYIFISCPLRAHPTELWTFRSIIIIITSFMTFILYFVFRFSFWFSNKFSLPISIKPVLHY